jgi:type IV secretory pathway VirB4 component
MPAINANAAQDFVPIKDIKNGVITLKDNSMRAVLMTSSLNFSLKSEDERNAIIYQFQDFLNSLDFSLQFFIESRKLDIRPYLALLEERYKEQTSDLMKIQTQEYINFVKSFTESTDIMTKSFFIVVPYSPAFIQSGKGGLTEKFFGGGKEKNKDLSKAEKVMESFEEDRTQLEQRISVVLQGLSRCGLRAVQLGTDEITELFYKIFNPGETEKPIKVN